MSESLEYSFRGKPQTLSQLILRTLDDIRDDYRNGNPRMWRGLEFLVSILPARAMEEAVKAESEAKQRIKERLEQVKESNPTPTVLHEAERRIRLEEGLQLLRKLTIILDKYGLLAEKRVELVRRIDSLE